MSYKINNTEEHGVCSHKDCDAYSDPDKADKEGFKAFLLSGLLVTVLVIVGLVAAFILAIPILRYLPYPPPYERLLTIEESVRVLQEGDNAVTLTTEQFGQIANDICTVARDSYRELASQPSRLVVVTDEKSKELYDSLNFAARENTRLLGISGETNEEQVNKIVDVSLSHRCPAYMDIYKPSMSL